MNPSHTLPRLVPEKMIGSGPEYVYVYYFPSDRKGARWPCKIGRASKDYKKRILAQQASMQETPCVGLLIRCRCCKLVEGRLHAIFSDRHLPTFGKEWFNTCPEEVEEGLDETVHVDLGYQFRLRRCFYGLTQQELAEKAGTRQATISKIECGKYVMLNVVQRVAKALDGELILD